MRAATLPHVVRLVIALLLAATLLPAVNSPAAAQETGSLAIYKRDLGTTLLPGSCFLIFYDAGNGQRGNYQGSEQCDRYDSTPNNGILVFPDLPPGNYLAAEIRAPVGYQIAADKPFAIEAGKRTNITVRNRPGGSRLIVSKLDQDGNLIPGACFDVYAALPGGQFGELVAAQCDAYDGANGRTVLLGLPVGNYLLYEFVVPPGYIRGAVTPFAVTSSGSTVRLSVVNPPFREVKSVTVNKVDPSGNPVVGACFQLNAPIANPNAPGGWDVGNYAGYAECDGGDGALDGKTTFVEVRAATYVLFESFVPQGYEIAPIQRFTKSRTSAKILTVVDPPGGATVRVTARNPSGGRLRGACFSVHHNVGGQFGQFVNAGCDAWDGTLDGQTYIRNLPAGSFLLGEWQTPAGYAPPPPAPFSIAAGRTAYVNVVHQPLASAAEAAEAPSPSATAPAPPTPTPTTEPPAATPTTEPTTVPEPTPVPTDVPTEIPTEPAPPEPTPTEPAPVEGEPPAEPTPVPTPSG